MRSGTWRTLYSRPGRLSRPCIGPCSYGRPVKFGKHMIQLTVMSFPAPDRARITTNRLAPCVISRKFTISMLSLDVANVHVAVCLKVCLRRQQKTGDNVLYISVRFL